LTRRIRLHEEAREEALDAARWYERNRQGLGEDFLQALGAVMGQLAAGTLPGLAVHLRSRRPLCKVLLRRFPYALYFESTEEECIVWAVAHQRRRPGYWRHRT